MQELRLPVPKIVFVLLSRHINVAADLNIYVEEIYQRIQSQITQS